MGRPNSCPPKHSVTIPSNFLSSTTYVIISYPLPHRSFKMTSKARSLSHGGSVYKLGSNKDTPAYAVEVAKPWYLCIV